jgi:hypothetical protein
MGEQRHRNRHGSVVHALGDGARLLSATQNVDHLDDRALRRIIAAAERLSTATREKKIRDNGSGAAEADSD